MNLPLIARADFPEFLAMGMAGFPGTFEGWEEAQRREKQQDRGLSREIPVSPMRFRLWLHENGKAATLNSLRLYADHEAHNPPRFTAGYEPPDGG